MRDIVGANQLIGTCGVCGKKLEPLTGLPLPGVGNDCETCGKKVCGACYSRSRQKCVQCTAGRDGWCSTPPRPEK